MTPTAMAICGLIVWSVLLTFTLITVRVKSIVTESKAFNEFNSDGRDMADGGKRLTRALGNSLENLALPVGIMLLALVTGHGEVTDGLAMIYLGCRVLQSVCHIISISNPMIMVRGTFFVAQLVIVLIWAKNLYGAA